MTEDSNIPAPTEASEAIAPSTSPEPVPPCAVPLAELQVDPGTQRDQASTIAEVGDVGAEEFVVKNALDQLRTAQMARAKENGHILAGDGTRCQRCGAAEWAALEGAPCEPNTEITHGEVDSQAEEQAAA